MDLLGAVKRAAQVDVERDAPGSPTATRTSGVHAVALPRTFAPPGPLRRNGHAIVVGRLLELALTAAPGSERARTVRLSLEDELSLKDGDERQLGTSGLVVAREGTVLEWRAALTTHFRRRYDLGVLFDAEQTTIS